MFWKDTLGSRIWLALWLIGKTDALKQSVLGASTRSAGRETENCFSPAEMTRREFTTELTTHRCTDSYGSSSEYAGFDFGGPTPAEALRSTRTSAKAS